MNPILAHPSAKSITLTLSSKCLDPVMMRIATLLLTGQHCASHTVAVRWVRAGDLSREFLPSSCIQDSRGHGCPHSARFAGDRNLTPAGWRLQF